MAAAEEEALERRQQLLEELLEVEEEGGGEGGAQALQGQQRAALSGRLQLQTLRLLQLHCCCWPSEKGRRLQPHLQAPLAPHH